LRERRPAAGERLSRATAQRLSLYLRELVGRPAGGPAVSSGRLALACGVNDAQVRRDLASLGHLGRRGIGYDADELATAIRAALGIDRSWAAVLVGVGNLARALLRYRGFHAQGFDIRALFDADPAKVGELVEGRPIEPIDRLTERVREVRADMAVLTVPADAAQPVADALVTAGVRGVLNFAPVLLKLPPRVQLVNVDLAIQLEQLAFLIQHADAPADAGGR
jgi:redox-sensing transcriptional repressor